jgi:NADPH:quinone reductase-like Zn-dependent oxidoreductase
MRALRFHNTGSLDYPTVAEVDRPKVQPGEALVRVRAAAINPSDVKNVLGKMAMTTVPRTAGRDFAGVVEDGPPEWVGREVFGTGGTWASASTAEGRVGFDLVDFYHREARIFGVDTLKLGFAESAAVLRGLMPGIERRTFSPPHFEAVTLVQAVGAYGRMNDGTARKTPVITFPA